MCFGSINQGRFAREGGEELVYYLSVETGLCSTLSLFLLTVN